MLTEGKTRTRVPSKIIFTSENKKKIIYLFTDTDTFVHVICKYILRGVFFCIVYEHTKYIPSFINIKISSTVVYTHVYSLSLFYTLTTLQFCNNIISHNTTIILITIISCNISIITIIIVNTATIIIITICVLIIIV